MNSEFCFKNSVDILSTNISLNICKRLYKKEKEQNFVKNEQ